jgi:hypothetical protein
MLTAAAYFLRDTDDEREIRLLADELYRRTDWQWAQNGGLTVCRCWKPGSQFLPYLWQGITASDGPGPCIIEVGGRQRRFFDYLARGVPDGPDDGTIAPWAVVASLPFAPEIVLPALDYFINHVDLKTNGRLGFKATFNPTHPDPS